MLTVGLILALLGGALGISVSLRIPATHSNVTLAGSIGKKELTRAVLAPYAQRTFGQNNTFINHSNSLTIWVAEGRQLIVVGQQPRAPRAGIEIDWKRQ